MIKSIAFHNKAKIRETLYKVIMHIIMLFVECAIIAHSMKLYKLMKIKYNINHQLCISTLN